MAKTLFLAKDLSARRTRIFRDHEILADRYPGRYPREEAASLCPAPASHPSRCPASMINHPPRRDPTHQFL